MARSKKIDTFALDSLPPKSLWPDLDFSQAPELKYPAELNCGAELLDTTVRRGGGGSTLFHLRGGDLTYGALLSRANKIAHFLVSKHALRPGERVLLRGPNTPMLAACWFGVVKAGGICVTTMPLLRERELSYIAEKVQIRLALCDQRWGEELEKTRCSSKVLKGVEFFDQDDFLNESIAQYSTEFENYPTRAEDIALIAFTSGTTGKAKATAHFHRDVMAICDSFPRSVLRPRATDIFCGTPPLAFTFGLGGLLFFPMRFGASSILLEKPGAEELLTAIQEHRATICFTSPTVYRAMLPLLKRYDAASLKKCVSAGEPLPLSTFQGWEGATGMKIIDGIGSTEMLHIFISAREEEIRPGATGKALPGYQAQIMNREGKPLPPGEVGLLAVKGPTGCRYLDDEERQREYVMEGWNLTGDAYKRDEDGYFWFQARADDMIISAGYNISGLEVESALLEHPDVAECGVVGAPDEARGQIVKAFVVLRHPERTSDALGRELQEFVKSRIAPYKYPRAIEFREALPRTETGKLQRFKLRESAHGATNPP